MSYPSRVFDKIHLTNNSDFKIPETAGIVCNGGGYFHQGIAIGNNNSDIPGSLRYNHDGLELKDKDRWINLKGFDNKEEFTNSIIVLNEDNLLQTTNLIIDKKDIYGAGNIEIESINNVKWPTEIGKEGNTLVYSQDGVLSVDTSPVSHYSNIVPSEETFDGKKGTLAFDDNCLYICIADNKWKKVSLVDL